MRLRVEAEEEKGRQRAEMRSVVCIFVFFFSDDIEFLDPLLLALRPQFCFVLSWFFSCC